MSLYTYLSGILCDDVFYAVGKYRRDLRRLRVSYVQSGMSVW